MALKETLNIGRGLRSTLEPISSYRAKQGTHLPRALHIPRKRIDPQNPAKRLPRSQSLLIRTIIRIELPDKSVLETPVRVTLPIIVSTVPTEMFSEPFELGVRTGLGVVYESCPGVFGEERCEDLLRHDALRSSWIGDTSGIKYEMVVGRSFVC